MPKTALITGTSSGLGKAAAKPFAANGWNVVATMRTPSAETELRDVADVLVDPPRRPGPGEHRSGDRGWHQRFGRIDALINNAGFGLFGLFEATPKEKIREQFDVNVFGVMDVTRAILPHFRANRSGMIINVSSGAGPSPFR